MRLYLHIGGPFNGEFRSPIIAYERYELPDGDDSIVFYVHKSVTLTEAMALMMHGYHQYISSQLSQKGGDDQYA